VDRAPREMTNPRLPDFIAIGPPRTGTTWLDQILRGSIGLPSGLKETHFFSHRYSLGLEWYARRFRDCPSSLPTGEFAPTYFPSPQARARIAVQIPKCKIVCTLREPVERFYSHYKMWRKLGVVKAPFEYVVDHHQELLSYTRYAANLGGWIEKFGRENVLVLIYEETRHDRQEYVNRLCDFIGAERLNLSAIAHDRRAAAPAERAPKSRRLARTALYVRDWLDIQGYDRVRNHLAPLFEFCSGGGAPFPPLDSSLQAELRARFEPEIAQVEELLGRDLSLWRKQRDPDCANEFNATGGRRENLSPAVRAG
jgi:hypothetical protein